MRETTNTSQFPVTPEGRYFFTVVDKPEKRRTSSGKSTYRIWVLRCRELGRNVRVLLFPWESKELLLAVGGEEISSENIDWDDETVSGKSFYADIVHEQDNNGNIREKLVNVNSPEDELKVGPAPAIKSSSGEKWPEEETL